MDLFKKIYAYDTANKAKEAGYYPYFHELTSKQDTVVHMEGREVIMIGSNNYLGLTSHPEVIQAAVDATLKYGTGVSGSRFLNGTLNLHKQFEAELAEFLHKEDCTIFSTGFQSNLGIISAVAGRNDIIFSDKENHASIYDGTRLSYAEVIRFEHSDMKDLEEKLAKAPENKGKLIITDGVFSMSGEIAKLPEIVELAKKYNARVMVDDAHGLGVMGEHGRGTAEHFGLEDEVDIIMGTFSKSLASLGGYVAANHAVVDFIRHNSRPYIFSAAIPAANTAAALQALRILKREPERVKALHDIAEYMRQGLKAKGLKIKDSKTPIIPIYTYMPMRTMIACNQLFEQGVYVNPVIPPATPIGECLIRTSYTATHTKEQIDQAIERISDVLKGLEGFNE
ncbi:MAG: pyridoxal phosphate-dependent aminotransferase family protein [Acholeplasmataceae bacterium]|nr:pyridoxal phosphate-dependent aminotransferase family protein [Acholeplasmataceae bacterium]MDD4193732.1 pyridoxal phosphate-dependent aminotransferase family protein [Acholeplasmataceae bacterium]